MSVTLRNSRPNYEPAYREPESVRETDPLLIPEILIWVLELASPEEKATAARVCRRWFDPALDALWRDLTDIAPFLKMFAVLKSAENPRMSPAEMLERITSYGARVRTLKCTASNSSIHDSGTAEVYRALCRGELQQYLPTVPIPSSGLFTNLRILEWRAEQTQPHVENTLDAVSYFLSPSLKRLHVSGIVEQKEFQAEDWYSFFPGPAIDCAPFFRTLNSMDRLRLEILELQTRGFQQVLTKGDEVGLFLRRHQKSLQHLRTWGSDLIIHFQQEIWELSRLRSLDVVVADESQAALFIGLANGASKIEDLRLTILSCGESRKWQELWDALKGLGKLTKLYLEIPAIGGLGEGDVKSMKEAWPTLSSLYILKKGRWFREPPGARGLERDFLNALARHFSQSLTTLGLLFEPNIRSSSHPISPVRFEKLQLLYIQSIFTPEDPEGLAQYFAQILPREAIFRAGPRNGWDKVVDSLERTRGETPQE